MASFSNDLGTSLANLERKLNEKEYFLLNASQLQPPPSRSASSLTALTLTQTGAFSHRGESIITPLARRVPTPRYFQGDSFGDGEEVVQLPSALGAGDLHCVYFSSYDCEKACLGMIDTSDRACAAERLSGQLHCGVKEHARKTVIESDSFYAPTGTHHRKFNFKTDPFVKKANVSHQMLPLVLIGLYKTMQWVHLIIDAVIPDPKLDLDLKASSSGGEDASQQSQNFSTISALEPFGSASAKYESFILGEDFTEDATWQDTTKDQRASLNDLVSILNRVGDHFPKLYHKVNADHRRLLNRVKQDIKVLK